MKLGHRVTPGVLVDEQFGNSDVKKAPQECTILTKRERCSESMGIN